MDRANFTTPANNPWFAGDHGSVRGDLGDRSLRRPIVPRRGRTYATYLKHALLHPYNIPILVLAIATGLISGSILVLAIAIASELFMLGLVPRLKIFRRHVDEILDQAERLEAAKLRAAVLLEMDEAHRQELERMEQLVDRIRDNLRRHGHAADVVLDDCIGLNRLTACYVRLAIAHKASKDSLASTNRQALEDKIGLLESMKNGTDAETPERLRRLAERRLAIAIKRAERWDQTQDDLEAITHQLATICELIHLVHEQSVSPHDAPGMTGEIDRFISDLEDNEGTLREIAELAADDHVEPEVLELGRMARAYGA